MHYHERFLGAIMVVNVVFGSSSLKYYLIFYLCFEKLGKRILVMFLLNLLLWKSYNRCALALFEICVFCLLSFCVRVSSLGYHYLVILYLNFVWEKRVFSACQIEYYNCFLKPLLRQKLVFQRRNRYLLELNKDNPTNGVACTHFCLYRNETR